MQTRKNLVRKTKKNKIGRRISHRGGDISVRIKPPNSQSTIPKKSFFNGLFTPKTYTKDKIINNYHKTLAKISKSQYQNGNTAVKMLVNKYKTKNGFNFESYYKDRIAKGKLNLDKVSTKNIYYPKSVNQVSSAINRGINLSLLAKRQIASPLEPKEEAQRVRAKIEGYNPKSLMGLSEETSTNNNLNYSNKKSFINNIKYALRVGKGLKMKFDGNNLSKKKISQNLKGKTLKEIKNIKNKYTDLMKQEYKKIDPDDKENVAHLSELRNVVEMLRKTKLGSPPSSSTSSSPTIESSPNKNSPPNFAEMLRKQK